MAWSSAAFLSPSEPPSLNLQHEGGERGHQAQQLRALHPCGPGQSSAKFSLVNDLVNSHLCNFLECVLALRGSALSLQKFEL